MGDKDKVIGIFSYRGRERKDGSGVRMSVRLDDVVVSKDADTSVVWEGIRAVGRMLARPGVIAFGRLLRRGD